jgi:tetratricopeptide (TPR) repeat protein
MTRFASQCHVLSILFATVVFVCASWVPAESQVPGNRAKRVKHRSAQYYVERGRKLIAKGLYAGAVRSLSIAIKKQPGMAQAYLLRGKAYDRMRVPERAIKDLTRYVRMKPSDPIGYILRGDARNFSSRHEEALNDYSIAIRLAPSSVSAFLGRGLAYVGMEKYTDAMKDYLWVLRLDPENRDALGNMGVACMLANKPLQAASYFRKALSLETDPQWRRRINEWMEKIVRYPVAKQRPGRGPTRSPVKRPRPMW